MANEENKNIKEKEEKEEIEKEEEEVSEDIVEETEKNDINKDDDEEEDEEEKSGKASFQETSNSKLPFIAIVVAIVLIAGALFFRGFNTSPVTEYSNNIHGYSYSYPQGIQLVAAGSIPAELAAQGVESMEQLNLTDGDSLLVYTNEESGDNIVYTTLELSTRENYVDFDSYAEALFSSLDESKEITGTDYVVTDSEVGDSITSTEYSFEMEVPIDDAGNTRTGVFYDNIFETEDGKAYSISFGYPKDVGDADEYLAIYRNLLSSFLLGEGIVEMPVAEASEEVEDETETEANEVVEVSEDEVAE